MKDPVQEAMDIVHKIDEAEERRAAAAQEKAELRKRLEAMLARYREPAAAAPLPEIVAPVAMAARSRRMMPGIEVVLDSVEPPPHGDEDAP